MKVTLLIGPEQRVESPRSSSLFLTLGLTNLNVSRLKKKVGGIKGTRRTTRIPGGLRMSDVGPLQPREEKNRSTKREDRLQKGGGRLEVSYDSHDIQESHS